MKCFDLSSPDFRIPRPNARQRAHTRSQQPNQTAPRPHAPVTLSRCDSKVSHEGHDVRVPLREGQVPDERRQVTAHTGLQLAYDACEQLVQHRGNRFVLAPRRRPHDVQVSRRQLSAVCEEVEHWAAAPHKLCVQTTAEQLLHDLGKETESARETV